MWAWPKACHKWCEGEVKEWAIRKQQAVKRVNETQRDYARRKAATGAWEESKKEAARAVKDASRPEREEGMAWHRAVEAARADGHEAARTVADEGQKRAPKEGRKRAPVARSSSTATPSHTAAAGAAASSTPAAPAQGDAAVAPANPPEQRSRTRTELRCQQRRRRRPRCDERLPAGQQQPGGATEAEAARPNRGGAACSDGSRSAAEQDILAGQPPQGSPRPVGQSHGAAAGGGEQDESLRDTICDALVPLLEENTDNNLALIKVRDGVRRLHEINVLITLFINGWMRYAFATGLVRSASDADKFFAPLYSDTFVHTHIFQRLSVPGRAAASRASAPAGADGQQPRQSGRKRKTPARLEGGATPGDLVESGVCS
jgi:hypothetical protein